MKAPIIFAFVLLLSSVNMFAQDIINFNNGSQQIAKILEVRTNDVVYKLSSNLNGPVYTTNKSEINSVQYENGYREVYANNNYSNNNNVTYYPNPQPVQQVQVVTRPAVVFPVQIGFGNRGGYCGGGWGGGWRGGYGGYGHHGGGHHGGHHRGW